MRFSWILGAVLLGIVPAACQPVPQPFSHVETGETVSLDLPDSGGIVVLDLANAPAPVSSALTKAMASALAERNVPTFTEKGNQKSHSLEPAIVRGNSDSAIVWTLYDPDGDTVDTLRQPIKGMQFALWTDATPEAMRRLAEQAAPKIAALVQNDAPIENTVPPLFVAAVTGAPGSGNRQLRAALERHLGAAGLALARSPQANALTIVGTVTVTPPSDGRQTARLEWQVVDAEDVEVGRIAQSNPIVAGSLDGSWGPVADQAAKGAAEGINALVRRINWNEIRAEKAAR